MSALDGMMGKPGDDGAVWDPTQPAFGSCLGGTWFARGRFYVSKASIRLKVHTFLRHNYSRMLGFQVSI